MKKDDFHALVFSTVEDLVADFLFYDRKNDEELVFGAIEIAIRDQKISESEIVQYFSQCLHEALQGIEDQGE